jgi:ElaB/YqjD/DUF883 family membrane-anchored ribosome-binding protein
MMKYSAVEFNRAKNKMANDFNAAMTDSADLLKAAAAVTGDGLAVAQTKLEEKLGSATVRLAFQPAVDKARKTAAAADEYVHDSPWTMIGIAAAAGLLIGFLASRRGRANGTGVTLDE